MRFLELRNKKKSYIQVLCNFKGKIIKKKLEIFIKIYKKKYPKITCNELKN